MEDSFGFFVLFDFPVSYELAPPSTKLWALIAAVFFSLFLPSVSCHEVCLARFLENPFTENTPPRGCCVWVGWCDSPGWELRVKGI